MLSYVAPTLQIEDMFGAWHILLHLQYSQIVTDVNVSSLYLCRWFIGAKLVSIVSGQEMGKHWNLFACYSFAELGWYFMIG